MIYDTFDFRLRASVEGKSQIGHSIPPPMRNDPPNHVMQNMRQNIEEDHVVQHRNPRNVEPRGPVGYSDDSFHAPQVQPLSARNVKTLSPSKLPINFKL